MRKTAVAGHRCIELSLTEGEPEHVFGMIAVVMSAKELVLEISIHVCFVQSILNINCMGNGFVLNALFALD